MHERLVIETVGLADDLSECEKLHAPFAEPAPRGGGMNRIVTSHRVAGDDDAEVALQSLDRGRAHTSVQMQPRDDYRVTARVTELFFEIGNGKRIETGFVNDCFAFGRLKQLVRPVPRRSFNAHPAIRFAPVRQAAVIVAPHRCPDVKHRHPFMTEEIEQLKDFLGEDIGGRIEFVRVEKILL